MATYKFLGVYRSKPQMRSWGEFIGWAIELIIAMLGIDVLFFKMGIPLKWIFFAAWIIVTIVLVVAGIKFKKALDAYNIYSDDRLKDIDDKLGEIQELKEEIKRCKHNEERHVKIADDIIAADPLKAVASYYADYTLSYMKSMSIILDIKHDQHSRRLKPLLR